jgi:hypothetical protein
MNYRGYDIKFVENGYHIYKDGEVATIMVLKSVQACKNVIDTYLRR